MPKESREINPAGIRLSKKGSVPLYMQVYQQFRSMILKLRFRPDDRLPASRNLAKELGVARVIINQDYEQLIMEGYLIGKPGSGTFVAAILPDSLLNAVATKASTVAARQPAIEKAAYSGSGHASSTLLFQDGISSLDSFPYKTWQTVGNTVLKN